MKFKAVVPLLPSATLTSLMEIEGCGSLSVMVPSPCGSTIDAFAGFVRLTKKISFVSSSVSPLTSTVIVFVVSPGLKITVPLFGR